MTELLAELFSSRVRAAVLTYVLPRPHRGFSLTELSHALDLPISSLQHECYKLERIGLLQGRREGNARRYRIDHDFPLERQLTAVIAAALGAGPTVQAALEDISGLEIAFLARPVTAASGAALPFDNGPVPLVLIGDIPLEAIDAAQERASMVLGLPPGALEAVFYRPDDWRSRLSQGSAYAVSLINGPRIDLIGNLAGVS